MAGNAALPAVRPSNGTPNFAVPRISPWLWHWFGRYTRRYIARHFDSVRLLQTAAPPQLSGPAVIYLNHPSWWDPMIALLLAQQIYPTRRHYAPIDAVGIGQYRFLQKIGFFPIEVASRRSGLQFLRIAESILGDSNATLWMTPQGAFSDVRVRPLALRPGLAHLAHRLGQITLVPLAIEYPYWNQKLPLALAAFGRAIHTQTQPLQPVEEWHKLLAAELEGMQNTLAEAAMRRNAEEFSMVLRGRTGIGGMYDVFRRTAAALTGRTFTSAHHDGAAKPS